MQVEPSALPEVLILEPRVFEDPRGFFYESYSERAWQEAIGAPPRFVQDNHSGSAQGVLRGLHYQLKRPQGKLLRVAAGEIFDVAVDLRRSAKSFGRWAGTRLSAQNRRMLWIPPGFAHGFLVLSAFAEVLYKVTDLYAPDDERCIAWDDPDIGIAWPLEGAPLLSARDRAGLRLRAAEVYP